MVAAMTFFGTPQMATQDQPKSERGSKKPQGPTVRVSEKTKMMVETIAEATNSTQQEVIEQLLSGSIEGAFKAAETELAKSKAERDRIERSQAAAKKRILGL